MPVPYQSEEYAHRGFLKLQKEIERSLAQLHRNTSDSIEKIIARNAGPDGLISKAKLTKIVDEYMEKSLRDYRMSLARTIKGDIKNSANFGIKSILGAVAPHRNITADVWKKTAQQVRKAVINTKSIQDGLTLSDRVWRLTDDNIYNLKRIVSSDILQGRAATTMSRNIRGYLNQPSTLRGAAKDLLQPGQGVYKSAYKNALRVTRTETTKAYADAQVSIAQKMGYKVMFQISAAHPEPDICDDYNGQIYEPGEGPSIPLHPHCMCHYVTVLPEE